MLDIILESKINNFYHLDLHILWDFHLYKIHFQDHNINTLYSCWLTMHETHTITSVISILKKEFVCLMQYLNNQLMFNSSCIIPLCKSYSLIHILLICLKYLPLYHAYWPINNLFLIWFSNSNSNLFYDLYFFLIQNILNSTPIHFYILL